MSKTVRFQKKTSNDFHSTVKERVYGYFKENNLSQHANREMVLKSLLHIFLYLATLSLIYSNLFQGVILVLLYSFLGLMTGLMGFNISHDALHGGYSSKRWVNKLLGYTFDYNGESSLVWKETHNGLHHTFTNIKGHDGDIDKSPWIRFHPEDSWSPLNRYQVFYTPILYGLLTISWVYFADYVLFTKAYREKRADLKEACLFYSFKALNVFLMVILPLLILSAPWWQILIGNFMMHFTAGIVIAFIFQLAHVVERVDFPKTDAEGKIGDEWAVHEMKTTANFATNSRFLSYWLGGLNFQVEHHLFPQVCHVHYPAISKIVKETALEYGVPYHEEPSFLSALKSHFKLLNRLGKDPRRHHAAFR